MTVTVLGGGCCCRMKNPDLNNEIQDKDIKVYPNPTDGKIKIEFTEIAPNTSVHVYDATGKAVYSNKDADVNEKTVEIDLSGEAKRIFYLEIVNSDKIIQFTKIVIQ